MPRDIPPTYEVSVPPAARRGVAGGTNRERAYVDFESVFRGSESEISQRQGKYMDWASAAIAEVGPTRPFLDVGAGRGEFLRLLGAAGVSAIGVDTNAANVAALQANGLEAVCSDANSYLRSLSPCSLGGIAANSVVEHMTPEYLIDFIELAYSRLAPGGCVILETNNPENTHALGAFWLDMTHVRPYHAASLSLQLDLAGFTGVKTNYTSPAPEFSRVRGAPSANYLEYVVIARKPSASAVD
jgi:SAM-dependent methyltransferase